jgi:thiamine-monophosphate kinase
VAAREETVLNQIRARVSIPKNSEVIVGIGDDCAVLRPRGAQEDLLFTTDQLIENVHFRRATHSSAAAGHKALARGLSDIAAMGGAPKFCLVSLAAPAWADSRWISGFYRGLLRLAEQSGTVLAGGDLARSAQLYCDIVVCGGVPRGRALLRSGARAGDSIYVSGTLGGSALGLETRAGRAWRVHLRPTPRLALGQFLRERLHSTAAMDLSDGLSLDLRRLAIASGLAAEIATLPVFRGASLEQALHGGEDYELLFTVPPGARVPAQYQGIPLTKIGVMRRGTAGAIFLNSRRLPPMGYDHFRQLVHREVSDRR